MYEEQWTVFTTLEYITVVCVTVSVLSVVAVRFAVTALVIHIMEIVCFTVLEHYKLTVYTITLD